jgi:DNA polymerase-3 subunit gamma/tau
VALALYRKYRPATFADVVGQEHVTEPLRTALAAGRINHAYLFSGPRGCGKTSSARILARSLNCEQGPTPDPCGKCSSCVALAPEGPGNIDVIELDAASHGGVDDARELRDRAFYAPAESRYRVFIVDEAHMVTTQGFNALLKIVEEPPEHLVFVFATTEPEKVLPTIRSRTHHYPFRLIPPSTLRGLLERICADERAIVAPPVFPLVIRAGGGSARDTLSVLDQLVAGAGPEGVTYERAVALLGVTDVALLDDTVDALAAGDGAAVFEAVDRLVEAGHDPRRFAADLLDRLRDLTLVNAVPDAAARGLVDAPADELGRMVDQASRLGAATLSRYAEIVHTGLTEMRGTTAPRLLLELLCGRMLLPAASTGDLALLQRLERMERRADIAPEPRAGGAVEPEGRGGAEPARTFQRPTRPTAGDGDDPAGAGKPAPARVAADPGPARADRLPPPPARSAPSTRPAEPVQPAQRRAEQPRPAPARPEPVRRPEPVAVEPPAGLDAADVRRAWPGVLERAKQGSRRTGALLTDATVKAVEGDTLVLTIGAAPLARMLSEQSNTEVISAALRAELGVVWRVRCEHSGAGGGGARPAAPTAPAAPLLGGATKPAAAPAQSAPSTRQVPARPPSPNDPPLPPEPPDDEEQYFAETNAETSAKFMGAPTSRRNPEEVAIELLSTQLGASAIAPPHP